MITKIRSLYLKNYAYGVLADLFLVQLEKGRLFQFSELRLSYMRRPHKYPFSGVPQKIQCMF